MKIYSEYFDKKLSEIFDYVFVPQIFVSLLVMFIIVILSIIIGYKVKKMKIDDKPIGITLLAILFYNTLDKFTINIMGRKNRGFTSIVLAISVYLFLSFIIGLTGLPSPVVYLATPLSLALITFFCVHITAMKENNLRYFKRYVEPFFVFLPINLVSMWAPTLSLTFRLFGNAVSGFCIMNLVYFSFENLSNLIFGGTLGNVGPTSIWIAPFFTPILHLYFDLFSGFIQTLVFTMLTLIYVAQEQAHVDESQVIDEVIA